MNKYKCPVHGYANTDPCYECGGEVQLITEYTTMDFGSPDLRGHRTGNKCELCKKLILMGSDKFLEEPLYWNEWVGEYWCTECVELNLKSPEDIKYI